LEAFEFPKGRCLARAKGFDGVRQAFEGFGKALFENAGAFCGNSAKILRYWGCREDQHKGNHREADSGDCGGYEHVIGVGNVEAEDVESDVLKRLDVAQNRECEEGKEHRKGG